MSVEHLPKTINDIPIQWLRADRGGTEYEARTIKGSGYGNTSEEALLDLKLRLETNLQRKTI